MFINDINDESEKENDNKVENKPKSPKFSKRGRQLKPKVIYSPYNIHAYVTQHMIYCDIM